MPRMRTLKPEAATSESLADIPRAVRWTFALLWTHCDDEGRALRNLRLIKAALYPLDEDVTVPMLDEELLQLEKVGALCVYEVDGREYLHVPSWSEHQHPNRKVASKIPPCPKADHTCRTHVQRSEPSMSTHASTAEQHSEGAISTDFSTAGGLTPVVVGEGRVDGVGDKNSRSAKPSTSDRFDEFWSVYPKRVAKAAARRRWDTLIRKGTTPDEIIAGAQQYAREVRGKDPQYVKQPDGWLNAGRWEDETAQFPASASQFPDESWMGTFPGGAA